MEQDHQDTLRDLQAMLEDEDFIAFLGRQPKDTFAEAHAKAIHCLAKLVAPATGNGRKRDAGKAGGRNPKRIRGKEPGDEGEEEEEEEEEGKIYDWKPITDIAAFIVDEDTLEQVEMFKEDGSLAAFFSPPQAERTYVTKMVGGDATKSLAALLVDTDNLSRELSGNHKLWLFHMLLWYRVKEILAPGAGAGRTFSMGKKQQDVLQTQLYLIHKRSKDWPADWSVDKTSKYIRHWAKIGFKVDILVSEFGPGCLFVLYKPLTEAFLLRRITKTGPHHDAAIAQLNRMGLKEYMESKHLDKFGDAIISYLLRPFTEAKKSRTEQTYLLHAPSE
ncbi:uncharacterized protein N0V89_011792 [Didymosphaeria variabile]|uniref:Uncharacterized protein n=1 Tax=Didymosphaeria variabile TaxID=1932322 RepID=A0A9W8XCD2_9PLEO|nr:uncharacterized protein N0V89_011792 [Didymosphaeria variabile]KAJ4345657.1 hypothetical protein N0V89_011792 [Didymosphaeria variabile]